MPVKKILTRRKKSGIVYVYYITRAYRDKNGKPKSDDVIIGKKDLETGMLIPNKNYIKYFPLQDNENDLLLDKIININNIENLQSESFVYAMQKKMGAYYFLNAISESIGLKNALMNSFSNQWKEILNVVFYLICTEDPLMYIEHWLDETEVLYPTNLTSQSVSNLLLQISETDRSKFFKSWFDYRSEKEFLTMDITSISSWSELIEDVEWGYNRDHDNLPQINLCLLVGLDSRLPIFHTYYSGSLKDVSTFEASLKKTTSYASINKPIMIVADKGFFSEKNLNFMFDSNYDYKFVMPIPFTSGYAKKNVRNANNYIDNFDNTIITGNESVFGITLKNKWENEHDIFTHIYFNPVKAIKKKVELYAKIKSLQELAKINPNDSKHEKDFKKYLKISTKSDGLLYIEHRQEIIEKELETCGWLVLISNQISDRTEALKIYREKDVVEKGFYRLKNSIDYSRLRIHGQKRLDSKIFLGFISLIIIAHMNKVMHEKNLYRDMTMKEMLIKLNKLKVLHPNFPENST
jgi:transposase